MPLKLKATKAGDQAPSSTPKSAAPASATPTSAAAAGRGGGGPKLKIRTSSSTNVHPTPTSATPSTATAGGPNKKVKISLSRKPSIAQTPRTLSLKVKGFIPPRPKGVGYDSEDDETEKDPAVEQQFVLRMQPGEDADYLRNAINERKIGVPVREGGADVSLRFLGSNHRRAVVTVRGRTYAAVLVDLPCVVETHKSWDKRGWWKVADISQMLLVLGRCASDEEARHYQLPKGVDQKTLQYAHGLTPPMHWVRKRRFRKRMSYQAIEHVEEEVEKMLQEDDLAEEAARRSGLTMDEAVKVEYMTRDEYERRQERAARQSYDPEDGYDEDAEGEDDIMDTVEDGDDYNMLEEGEEELLGADLEAAMAQMEDIEPTASEVVQSPAPIADRAATFTAAEQMVSAASPAASTPAAETPAAIQTEQSSDEDESEDEDSIDDYNEDAAEIAAEKQQQLEEVADLERELKSAREKLSVMKNQLLKNKQVKIVQGLEEDLRLKRRTFGLDAEDDE